MTLDWRVEIQPQGHGEAKEPPQPGGAVTKAPEIHAE